MMSGILLLDVIKKSSRVMDTKASKLQDVKAKLSAADHISTTGLDCQPACCVCLCEDLHDKLAQ